MVKYRLKSQFEVTKMIQLKKMKDLKLTLAEKMVLMNISAFVDNELNCFPSLKAIADISCVTVRTVSRSISKLSELGYITVAKRNSSNGVNISNLYTLNIDAINGFKANDKKVEIAKNKVVILDGFRWREVDK